MMINMWNTLIYGCPTKEDYDLVKNNVRTNNHKVWRYVTAAACFYFTALFISTFYLSNINSNRNIYAVFAVVMGISFFLLRFIKRKGNIFSMAVIYSAFTWLLLFGVILGTLLSPNDLAVTYHVLVIALPLILIETPFVTVLVETGTFIIFCVLSWNCKSGHTLSLDIYNAVVFWAISQFVIVYNTNVRMRQFLNETSLVIANATDALSGLHNRIDFDRDIQKYDTPSYRKQLIIAVMDLNGLKVVNDTMGHEAGDEMIKGVANCIVESLGMYGKVYRVGGDEFTALLFMESAQIPVAIENFHNSIAKWHGNMVERISISCGYVKAWETPHASMQEMLKNADKMMYREKRNYYSKNGMDRRGSQAANGALCALYTKIIKINISEDTYENIYLRDEDKAHDEDLPKGFSDTIRHFVKGNHIHPEDIDSFENYNMIYLRNHFSNQNATPLHFSYRRNMDGNWVKVSAEIVPAEDFSPDNKTLYMYVKRMEA